MFDFRFPDVGEGIAEGEIVKWRVRQGDAVKEDDILLEIETDKAVVEIPSPKAGVVSELCHKEGDTVKVGEVLVRISEKGEPAAKIEKRESDHYTASVVGQIEEAPADSGHDVQAPSSRIEEIIPAMPSVRRLARDLNIDLSKVQGTGHENRVTENDIRKAAEAKGITEVQPAVHVSKKYDFYGYVDRVPLKGVRKSIAEHMIKSFTTAVHVSHMDEADITELYGLREKEKPAAGKMDVHLTFMPFIIRAVIAALKEHPSLNASMDDEHAEIVVKKYYNIGVAVDTPDGLMVPVIKNAHNKEIIDLAKELSDLADRAQTRKLDLADLKGSSFTITNVGVVGGLYATPIINWPDVAILAVGRIHDKVVYRDGKIVVRKVMPFTVTFDHRVIDGAEAARFSSDFKKQIEDPTMLLLGK